MTCKPEVQTKEVIEFGQKVTLYRIYTSERGRSTLWHRELPKAWQHFARLRAL